LSALGFVANSGHEGRGYPDTEKIDSLERGNRSLAPLPSLGAHPHGHDKRDRL